MQNTKRRRSQQSQMQNNLNLNLNLCLGTTGLSKGVVLTHRSIIATSLMVTSDQEEYGEGRSVFLIVVPLFHVMGLITFIFLSALSLYIYIYWQ
ncbi:putative AMP-dependent synthetase/ligase [Helianthus annuus]|nr:putative AMP-dependent synthetase/ligase [Helianthus annuus]KAJ0564596.1 putative AMP-dependent synthetase/ligase [Helianthus annuus]KAJ0732638.1 putative AMP-dependent synthetase/ligase [Helianthus annuus]